jgi:hypothetical protein
MKSTSVVDLAWLAGIMDGEGSIFIMKQQRTDRERQYNYILRISVQSTDGIMAQECLKISGEGACFDAPTTKENQSNTYKWQVSGKRAKHVLQSLVPFMRVKKEQAQVAIDFQETTKKHWRQMTVDDYKKQEDSYYKLKQQKIDLKIGKDSLGYQTANQIIKTESDFRVDLAEIRFTEHNPIYIEKD